MSDSIVSCFKYENPDGSIDHYEVTFSFDYASEVISTAIVNGSDLTNPEDLNEVKAKACLAAVSLKAMNTHAFNLTKSPITKLDGSVSL